MAWDSGTYRRDASKANRGKPFEDFINFANEKYQAKGIAVMHKVPTEFIPLRGAHGQVANCKVERKSCVDYLGRFRDIPVAVEQSTPRELELISRPSRTTRRSI